MDEVTKKFIMSYGFAFAALNKVERCLELLILDKKHLNKKILEEATFGKKFSWAKPFILKKKLQKKIGKLVGDRNDIAHQEIIFDYQETGLLAKLSIKKHETDEKFLIDVTERSLYVAQELIKKLKRK